MTPRGGRGTNTGRADADKTPPVQKPGRLPTAEEAACFSYCWSHGYCKPIDGAAPHTSASCKKKRDGHKGDSTADNKMDGETRVCNSWWKDI